MASVKLCMLQGPLPKPWCINVQWYELSWYVESCFWFLGLLSSALAAAKMAIDLFVNPPFWSLLQFIFDLLDFTGVYLWLLDFTGVYLEMIWYHLLGHACPLWCQLSAAPNNCHCRPSHPCLSHLLLPQCFELGSYVMGCFVTCIAM